MIDCEKPGDCAYPGCECEEDDDPFNEEHAMNHPNRSKQQQASAFPELTRAQLEELCLRQNQRVRELLAALKTLYSEFKAYRPACFEAAEKAALESPDMVINDDGSLRVVRGSTVMIVLNARRAIAKCEGR